MGLLRRFLPMLKRVLVTPRFEQSPKCPPLTAKRCSHSPPPIGGVSVSFVEFMLLPVSSVALQRHCRHNRYDRTLGSSSVTGLKYNNLQRAIVLSQPCWLVAASSSTAPRWSAAHSWSCCENLCAFSAAPFRAPIYRLSFTSLLSGQLDVVSSRHRRALRTLIILTS